MEKFGIGQPVRREEDVRFITGAGHYTDDIRLAAECFSVVVRSPHAHARIEAIDTDAAGAMPGVLCILTHDDYRADGLGPISVLGNIETTGAFNKPPRTVLADGVVRHVGDPVVFVVADSRNAAQNAAELVEIDYRPLPAVVNPSQALAPDSSAIWPDFGSNLSFHFEKGDRNATDAVFDTAPHVITLDLVNNRVIQNTIEARAAIGEYHEADDSMTLHVTSQSLFGIRGDIAGAVFGIEPEKLRVIAPDVGGGFGSKNFVYPEYVLVLWAARKVGRPVKWTSERSEAFVSDVHARDHVTRAELAVDHDGTFLGLRVNTLANMGAYLSAMAPVIPTMASWPVQGGAYVIPHVFFEVDAVFTNTVPVDAYRGAGRPEAAYIIERLADMAAARLNIDTVALRKMNFISAFPHKTSLGQSVDCGAFVGNLDKALAAAKASSFGQRRDDARKRGKLRGLAFASYLEITLGNPAETSTIRFDDDGGVTLLVGTNSNGQGHETSYKQIAADVLGIAFDKIRFLQGDTGQIAVGGGHGGSRSMGLGGTAMKDAAVTVCEKGRALAAHVLDAQGRDVLFSEGVYSVAGTNRSIGILELAQTARSLTDLPEDLESDLTSKASVTREGFNFPNGCHAVEVEVDQDTGRLEIVAYTIVDDFGTVINPLLAAGQAMGGTTQGIGQAMLEHTAYDPDTGQLLSGSLMDYTLPRASDVPDFAVELNQEAPTKTNPLGVKGAGEAGCTGAPPAVVNAVVDALKEFGVTHLDMPLTSEKIWRAINNHA